MRRNLPPGDDEKDACKKAFSLRSDLGDNISNMAGLREEELRFARRSLSPEEVNKTLKLLTDLLESSPSLATDPWVKIRLAEIYGLRDYNLDPSHGEELFKECIEQWPLNTMVWHKAAKFYHLGGSSRGEGPFVNYEKAKEYYKKSLELRGSNFPCLMDYLKLLRQPFDAIDEMADEIDRYLPMMKNENEIRRLLIIKGILLWIHYMDPKKRTQACYTWLTVIKKFPSAAFEVGQSIKSKRNEIVGLQDINTLEINELLKKMLDDMEVDESFHKPINMLMSELSRVPRTKDSNNGPRGNQVNNGSRANEVTNGSRANQVNNGSRANQVNNGSRANQVNDGSRANQVNDGPRANQVNNGPRMKEAISVNDEVFKEAVKKVLDNPKIVRKPTLPDRKEECKDLSTSQKDSSPPVSTASATSIKTDLSPESEVNTITVAVQDLTTSPKDSSPPVSTTKTDLSPEPINATKEHISALEAFINNNTSSSSTPLRYASRGRGRRFPPPSSINDP